MPAISAGLEDVVAATTTLSEVDGERGELIVGGFPVGELAARATFEETTWLLWHGELPTRRELEMFRTELAAARELPEATLMLLRECATRRLEVMDALRIAAGTMSLESSRPAKLAAPSTIVAQMPTIVAAYSRLRQGVAALAPRVDLGHAANFLYMLNGQPPD